MDELSLRILDSLRYGVLVVGRQGEVILNKKARQLLGCENDRDVSAAVLAPFASLGPLEGAGEEQAGRVMLPRGDEVLVQIFPFDNKERGAGTVYVIFEPRQPQRMAEAGSLGKSLCDFEAILENTYDGLYITDGKADTIMVNKAYERITGVRRQEVLGKNTRDSVHTGIIDRSVSIEVIEKKAPVTIVQESRGGKKILVSGNPVIDEKTGEVVLVVNNVRDITELVELQNQLHERTLEANRYLAELDRLKAFQQQRSKFVSMNRKMLDILDMAAQIAPFDSNVLITGESGVGKGLLARLIHEASDRRNEPFVKINCAGIPEDLFESELFGYEPGAFSGASTKGKKGLLEVADRGTVFLDEIGDMSLRLQSKLLTLIEEKEMTRLGSTRTVQLRIRIMAATNQDLTSLVEKKKFRQDLFFRLNTISLDIPPLRERPEDIIPLAHHFIEKLNGRYHTNKSFEMKALHMLSSYRFPGNVRELANLTEQAFLLSKGDVIGGECLTLDRRDVFALKARQAEPAESALEDTLEKVEYRILKAAIEKWGSTYKAARSLNMSQSTFVRKMKKHSLKNANAG